MAKTVRYTIDLTTELHAEIEKIAKAAGITKSEIFRRALGLLKLAHEAWRNGEHIGVGKNGAESLKKEWVLP